MHALYTGIWTHLARSNKLFLSIWNIGCILLLICKECSAVQRLSFSAIENTTVGTEVGSLPSNSSSTYFLTSGDSSPFRKHFDVARLELSGSIVTTTELDHESNPLFDATVYDFNAFKSYEIEIHVTDINDNYPTFAKESLLLEISEATQVGSKFDIGSATDSDSFPNNVQGYRITAGNASDIFSLNIRHVKNFVFADLVVDKALNREKDASFYFTVQAFDGGFPPKTGTINITVHISDTNDNAPQFDFTRYSMTIKENSVVGTDVITLNATDQDIGANGNITYMIDRTQSDPNEFFRIDPIAGRVYLNKRLDFEQNTQHKLVIEATDAGAEPQVTSTVLIVSVEDINDNKPEINIIFLDSEDGKVSEAAEPGDYIARVSVSDADSGDASQINVTLSGGDSRFGLQSENGVVYLVCLKEPLDRETQASHHITLTATDLGSPPQTAVTSLTITVEDYNDNPPQFEQDFYEVFLPEDSFRGTYVTQLQAADKDIGANAAISYRLASTDQSQWFNINPDSGLITTMSYLDYSINPAPYLIVIATDKGSPPLSSNTTLLVNISDTSDSAPRFEASSYSTSVPENAPVGRCILQVQASDSDADSVVTYTFVSGSDQLAPTQLRLNSTTGDICLASSLDRETTAKYELQVQATDESGRFDRARVYVTIDDVNEFRPVFHPLTYMVNVDRNADVGTPVTMVTATDSDFAGETIFGRVTYTLTSGNEYQLFELDMNSGRLSVTKALGGLEVDSLHRLTVEATDGGGLSSEENASISVSIVDGTSTGGPVFTSSVYSFSVDESLDVNFVIGNVEATTVNGSAVTYRIIDDPPNSNWFSVNPTTGDVAVFSSMDREILPSVTFQVVASSGTPPSYGIAKVSVTLNDVNDNAPHFYGNVRGELDPVITPFNVKSGEVIANLRAIDNDMGENGTVRYDVTSSYFGINDTTGDLFVASALPRISVDYSLSVKASDLGVPPLSTIASLVVLARLPDVNCPQFDQEVYNFHIPENYGISTIIASLDAASVPSSSPSYHLDGSSSLLFSIYPNGSLYLDASLDREEEEEYQFMVSAEAPPSTSSVYASPCIATAHVTITVDDVNDNSPQFTRPMYSFHVEENLPKGTALGKVFANDRDSSINAQVKYQLAVANNKFAIHLTTGVISTLTSFDREVMSEYTFLVDASDGVNMAETIVHVIVDDVNDNPPRFDADAVEHLAVVSVSATKGTWVADVRARDADFNNNARLTYSIFHQLTTSFEIEPETGAIYTSIPLTQSEIGIHTLTLRAEDRGPSPRSASTSLKIKVHAVDENPSQFSDNKFVFAPSEDSSPGDELGSFGFAATTRRRRSTSSLTSYHIIGGNDANIFSVNETTGDVTLNRKLNYEDSPQYSITVERRNGVNDDVTILTGQINIRDVNDHTPVFSSSSVSIGVDENAPFGMEVWRFTAADKDSGLDGQVVFSLVSESPAHAFVIDRFSGALLVDSLLDRENISEYLLVINASDSSLTSPRFSTSSCVVVIRDVNDNAPQFVSRTETYVMEDEPIDFPIIRVAAEDLDVGVNGHVTYSLVTAKSDVDSSNSDEEFSFFHLNSSTGVLTLTKSLDHERSTTHELNISATDRSARDQQTSYQLLVIHVVDVNDVTPHFERVRYEVSVAEGQSSGVVVTKIRALDEDSGVNGELTYSLQEGLGADKFSIDPVTGVLTTTVSLDRETVASYRLTVFVQDNAFPSLYDWCTVDVLVGDINDNSPKFNPLDGSTEPPILTRLSIPEQVQAPEIAHVVSAFDPDADENGKISFSILEGNNDGDFYINETSGELWIQRQLDRETTASYQLQLAATDHGQPPKSSVVTIEITVLDWNDNDPQFVEASYLGSVDESMSRGQYVLTVRALDADLGMNSEVRYFFDPSSFPSLEGSFRIDPATGVVTTAAVLDREAKSRYEFSVMAVDSAPYDPRNSTVPIQVDVNDINDNPPVLESTLVRLNVSRNVEAGVSIGHVMATDADGGVNGDVIYSLSNSSDLSDYFTIGRKDGNIRVNKRLGALPEQYSFNVTASDQGNPPLTAEALVLVSIVGESSSVTNLQFEKSSYSADIREVVQKGFLVTTVKANPTGASENISDITYKILFGNDEGRLFAISNDGQITVNKPSLLDFETKPKIPLFVSATASDFDASLALYGFTTVNIQVLDENDNSPKFSQLNYYTRVWEEQEPAYVMQLFASDADSENNGKIRFHIASGDPDNAFLIGQTTGFLQTTRSLDREIHDRYELIVYATDLGETRKTGTSTVHVDVVDINDHTPTLIVPSEPIHISEEAAVGSLLATVTANDVDTNQLLSFYFASGVGNPGGFFSIDRHAGNIFLTKSLDHEKVNNMTLIVEASDGANSDSAQFDVIVTDVNDNAPQFEESLYHTKISELTPTSIPVITVHADDVDSGDNGMVMYKLLEIIPNKPMFVIDSSTGVISTNETEPFSPHSSVFNLEIEARDHGNPPKSQSVSVRIERTDVNNNAPSFSQRVYEESVSESASVGFSVINVTATDADYSSDNKNIYYEIVSGNVGGAFKILTNIQPGKQSVGEIRVANELDRENRSSYDLTVSALDHGTPQLSSTARVEIRILDVNDNQPVFNQSHYIGSVKENNEEPEPRYPKSVLSVFASDPDTSITSDFKFKIISGNDRDAFGLEECSPPSAACAHVVAKLVDYETKPRYELTIQVSDQRNSILARSSTATITIDVVNVNEYRPVVEQFKLEKILETTKANQTLFHINALDNDAGYYGRVSFIVRNDSFSVEGRSCLPPHEMFVVEDVTGAVKALKDLDYETCQKYFFVVDTCDPLGCTDKVPVEISILPVDEYPPRFLTDGQLTLGSGYRFQVPYGSPAGHIVGQVNATDEDEGEQGKIRFSLGETNVDEVSRYYVINETSGVISLLRHIDSGNARILVLTASSTSLKTVTHVTIEVTGTPSIAPEAQILSIVFGVIAAIAIIIVIVLTVRHCMNKRAFKSASAKSENVKNSADVRRQSNNMEFYDVVGVGDAAAKDSAYAGVRVLNGSYKNGQTKNGGKIASNISAGDFQLQKISSGSSAVNGSLHAGIRYKGRTPPDGQGNKYLQEDADRTLRHRIMKVHQPAHTGNDGSAEDEEVNQLTSTPTSSGRQSVATSLLSNKRQRVADSGIQQDMDKTSESTDPLGASVQAESVESIHEFGDEGGDEDVLDVNIPGLPSHAPTITQGGGEEMPDIDILGFVSRAPKTNISSFLGSLDEGRAPSAKPNEKDWNPEFQPISSVFTEIARLREESVAAGESDATKPSSTAHVRKPTYSASTLGRPPPLLTSIPQQRGNLAAPVPIALHTKQGFHSTHVPLKGLYPRPKPHYGQSSLPAARVQGVPPPYSQVVAARPGSGSSAGSLHSRRSQHSQPLSSNLAYAPSTASALSVTSMPRTPLSLDSSFTSPAMSPSLSPSLTPLTAHSPPAFRLHRISEPTSPPKITGGLVRSKSNEASLSEEPKERMVHV